MGWGLRREGGGERREGDRRGDKERQREGEMWKGEGAKGD